MSVQAILGIDIAKDTFDVTLWQGTQRQSGQFSNDPAGFKQLSSWLRKRKVGLVWACMEATGHYGDELAEYLYAAQHTLSVVNPLAIKSYGQSQLRRNKSDKLEA